MSAKWVAIYRLQLHAGFPLDAAGRVLPYLADLGVSHVYLSPCLQAVPGSQHGYDVTDPSRISDDLGGEAAWARFVDAARAHELKILLDIVPNHMSASGHNPWWDDLLAHGPFSNYAAFFDIKIPAAQPFRVHLCTLARAYGEALEAGDLKLEVENGRPRLRHFDNTWPLAPASWGEVFASASGTPRDPCFHQLRLLQQRGAPTDADRALYRLHAGRAETLLAEANRGGRLQAAVTGLNNDPERLDAILRLQFFLLHGWKLAGELTNYRRFFDVGSLSGIRMELPQVLTATHARIETMVARGEVDGLRVDHPDGLRDPLTYFKRLRRFLPDGGVYVQQILENDQRLMNDWPIDGTVGYDFLAKVNRLWMDDQRIDVLTATYSDFTGHPVNFAALVREKKREIVDSTFSADLERLAVAAIKSARAGWRTRDISPRHLRQALARATVALGAYRTYRTAATPHDEDRRVVADAEQSARIRSTGVGAAALDFLLSLFPKPHLEELDEDFIAQWQQLAPAVMAKGVEDTTFYCFDRLVSCNEVGSQASLIGISAGKFSKVFFSFLELWPQNFFSTPTHPHNPSQGVPTRMSRPSVNRTR